MILVVLAPVAATPVVVPSRTQASGAPAPTTADASASTQSRTNDSRLAASGLSPLPGPILARDLDDDGRYEDVNGDGTVTNGDGHALLVAVQTDHSLRVSAFDFDSDGRLTEADARTLFAATSSGALDSDRDSDGLPNEVEQQRTGTDPDDADSNDTITTERNADDGTPDGRESFDGDNLTATEELRLGTVPGETDTDGDGTPDHAEAFSRTVDVGATGASVSATGDGQAVAQVRGSMSKVSNSALGSLAVSRTLSVETVGNVTQGKVTIPYNESAVTNESALTVLRYDSADRTLETLDTTISVDNNTVTATTTGFSEFVVVPSGSGEASIRGPDSDTSGDLQLDAPSRSGWFWIYLNPGYAKTDNVNVQGPQPKPTFPESYFVSDRMNEIIREEENMAVPAEAAWYKLSVQGDIVGRSRIYNVTLSAVGSGRSDQTTFQWAKGNITHTQTRVGFESPWNETAYDILVDQYSLSMANSSVKSPSPECVDGASVQNDFEDGTVKRVNGTLWGRVVERGNVGDRSLLLDPGTYDSYEKLDPGELCLDANGEFTFTAVLRTAYRPNASTEEPPDPATADLDGDGLNDSEERAGFDTAFGNITTSPRNADTDRDGLDDPRELELGTHPKNEDSDGDGLTDGTEATGIATVQWYDLSADGDSANTIDMFGDSEPDGVKTDPLTADTDGDTLPDGNEVGNVSLTAGQTSIRLLNSDPTDNNTDDVGLTDQRERAKGSDPTVPEWLSVQVTMPILAKENANTGSCDNSFETVECAQSPPYRTYILPNQNEYNPASTTLGGKPRWLSDVNVEEACTSQGWADSVDECTFRLLSFGVRVKARGGTINPIRDYPDSVRFEANGGSAIVAQGQNFEVFDHGDSVYLRYASQSLEQEATHSLTRNTVSVVVVSPSGSGYDAVGSIDVEVGFFPQSAFLRDAAITRRTETTVFTEVSTESLAFEDATRRASPGEAKDMARRSMNYLGNTLEDAAGVIAPTGGSAVQIIKGGGGAASVAVVEGMVLFADVALEKQTKGMRSDGFVPRVITRVEGDRLDVPRTIYGVTIFRSN